MTMQEIADRLEEEYQTVETVWAGRKYIYIRFIGDMAEERLTEQQAKTYLSWIRAGNSGTWFDFTHDTAAQDGEG